MSYTFLVFGWKVLMIWITCDYAYSFVLNTDTLAEVKLVFKL
jgi:hypothetical protein